MFTSRLNQNAPFARAPFARVNGQPSAPSKASQHTKSAGARKSGHENQAPAPAHSAARRRSPSLDADSAFAEAQAQYREVLEKKKQQDERLRIIGRIIARFFSPFDDLGELLHLAITSRATPRPRLNAEQRAHADLGDRILVAFKDLGGLIDELTLSYVADKLTKSRNLARTFDTNKIRRAVMHWGEWDIKAAAYNDKGARGWSHEDMARLILPPSMEYTPELMEELKNKNDFVYERELPRLCFEDSDTSKASGFLKHPALLRGAITFMRGFEAGLNGRGAPGNTARKYNLSSVTDEFVGYVVCQCRYGFSDETSFTPDGAQGFDYRELYDAVLKEIKKCRAAGRDGAGARAMDELMAYWNEWVFTAHGGATRADEEDDRALRAEEFGNQLAERWGMEAEEEDTRASQDEDLPPAQGDLPSSDGAFPPFNPPFEPEEGNYESLGHSEGDADGASYHSGVFSTQLDDGNGYAPPHTGMASSSSSSSSSLSPPPFPPPPPPPAKATRKRKQNPRVVEDEEEENEQPRVKRPNTRSQSTRRSA